MANVSYDEAQDRMRLLPNYYKWIYSSFSKYVKGRVMEVGAGAGHLIPSYIQHASHIYALDHDPVLVDSVLKNFRADKVSAILADLRTDFNDVIEGEVDTIIALDLLEHFADDLELVRKLAAALSPGGHMIVKVPAGSRLYGDMDEASGHYRRYDRDCLSRVMSDAGLEEVLLIDFNRLGALAYRYRCKRNKNFSKSFSVMALKGINAAIPLLAVADSYLPGNGLSLIGVYKKPPIGL